MEPGEALFAALIAFSCSLVLLGLFGACLRGCAVAIRNSRVPAAPAALPIFYQQPQPPGSRKLKDPRLINHPGGEVCIGIQLKK